MSSRAVRSAVRSDGLLTRQEYWRRQFVYVRWLQPHIDVGTHPNYGIHKENTFIVSSCYAFLASAEGTSFRQLKASTQDETHAVLADADRRVKAKVTATVNEAAVFLPLCLLVTRSKALPSSSPSLRFFFPWMKARRQNNQSAVVRFSARHSFKPVGGYLRLKRRQTILNERSCR